ncbi:MAG: acyl-CoA dehydrogenase family protein [Deltaproteobacteria bacterium]|nr:acyl-CoA dehydrogenase family protein [Deltaproteobacteria bacterium]
MSTALISEKGKNREEIESLEVAEEAREKDWTEPSFVAELFMGRVHTEMVDPYPEQSTEDRAVGDAYLAKLRTFLIEKVDADKIDSTGEMSPEMMQGLIDLGAFGMKIPKEYGGLGLSQTNYGRAMALICSHCASTGGMLSAHQSIGVPQPLYLFGTEEQKKKYLPRLAKGAISAFALTEPDVGSDPARMTTTATPTADGSHYIINGTKLWCTNGAQTPAIMKNGREKKQISAFIVEKTMPGFEVVHRCRFSGLSGIQNALLKFTNVKIPKENLIWGEGRGLRLALITLNAGRLSLPAGAIGGARQCVKYSRDWGNERKQWGAAVGQHEAGARKIASMTAHLFAMESITWLAAAWVDRKSHDIRLEAAMAKLFCSERTHQIIEDTVQLRGGRGYERASSLKARGEKAYPAERMLRDSRINMIVEGTSEILRLFIAREALDRHLAVAGDALNPKLGIGRRLLSVVRAGAFYSWWYPYQFIGQYLNVVSLFAPGHLGYAKRTSHRLAKSIFHLMLLNGPALEKRQLQLGRIVDIATDLFAISATVGRARAKHTLPPDVKNVDAIADLFCREAKARIRANFRALRCNDDRLLRQVSKQVLNGDVRWIERESV